MEKGVDTFAPDITADLELDIATYNVTSGINQGLGPRYGMAPIPGQADSETVGATTPPGLMRSEAAANTVGLTYRYKVYACFPIRLRSADLSTYVSAYAWVIARKPASTWYLDVVFTSTYTAGSPGYYSNVAGIQNGLSADMPTILAVPGVEASATYENWPLYGGLPFQDSVSMETNMQGLLTMASEEQYVAAAAVTITGRDIPAQWLFGGTVSTPTLTLAPSVNLWLAPDSGVAPGIACGVPPEWQTGTFKKTTRSVVMYCLDAQTAPLMSYRSSYVATTTVYKPAPRMSSTIRNIDTTGQTWTKIGASVAYGSVESALVNDNQATINSGYKAVAIAGKKAWLAVIKDTIQSLSGGATIWHDPTVHRETPSDIATTTYSANATIPTCFYNFPLFLRGTAMVASGGVKLNAANSGLLRANTVYEFTFAVFNKNLNYETNVGTPVKFQTGVADFVSLCLYDTTAAASTVAYYAWAVGGIATAMFPFFGAAVPGLGCNYLEYRFYYRPEGAYDWLPALFIDVAKFWFYPWPENLSACIGAVAGLPGGQPGGFVDNSPLPADEWIDVKSWKSRLWWCSAKQICFSPIGNLFCYPGRNSIAAGTGEFRGIMPHAYPGQADQNSRLIIFGTKEIYVGRFTGEFSQAAIQVSPDTVGTFDIDGSDFQVDVWTTVTAFSARSAVVADGDLYYWGPQGIRRDNGTEFPENVSIAIEPDIFTLYDAAKTNEIHCTFNDQTKEIVWFYPPKTADSTYPTYALTYNVRTGKFLPQKFAGKVDASQKLTIEDTNFAAGDRTLVMGRASTSTQVQRASFFDHRCRSGDFMPTRELMVKTIATQGSGKRLTLAAGFDATLFATIVVDDPIAFTQFAGYSNDATATDCIVKVTATNAGAGTIDVSVPAGAVVPNASYAQANYIPIWHLGINGIAWQIKTGYWAPGGLSFHGIWLYILMLMKMRLLPSVDAQEIELAYRTMTSGDFADATDTLELADNCDGQWQLYHPLQLGEGNINGQAIKLLLSGTHIGSEWVLQYLEAHANIEDGNCLKEFEG